MRKILFVALMLVSAPAMAAPDAAMSKGMAQCSVLFADEARLAHEHNSPDNQKSFETASAGFLIGAMAYAPGSNDEAIAAIDGWKAEYAASVAGLTAEQAKAKYLECEVLEPKVTEVVQAIKASQAQQQQGQQ